MERRRERERDGRGEKGEGGEVGMEMERDGASQHDRMTDGLSDEQGGKEEGQADIEHAAITDVRFRCVCMCTASLSHLRTMLPESSSCPQPAQRPNHAT